MKEIPIAWKIVKRSPRMAMANELVKAGPTIATIPVLFAPILAMADVVKKVGITVQKIAMTKIQNSPMAFTSGVDIDLVSA